jgi:putative FmdB family regulatory protein
MGAKKMPLYEYKCKECDKTFEVLQRMNAEPISECLYCSGGVEKLISRSSFQLKGSGWYVTDYRNKAEKKSTTKSNVDTVVDTNKRPNKGKDQNATIK